MTEKVDPSIKNKIDQNYQTVINVISQFGKPNPAFPNDRDLDYGTIAKNCNSIGGLGTVLKNMKKQKMVDFATNGFFKESDIITLISDYAAEAVPTQITYEEITTKVQVPYEEKTSHQKTEGW